MTTTDRLTPQELAEACAKAMWEADHASRALNMVVDHVAPGEAVLTMTVTQEMTNGHGAAHGGYVFTLADSAFAFACNTYNQMTVAQNCSITYLAPGALGDQLTASAKEIFRKGRSGLYDVSVSRNDGELIAAFRGLARTVGKTLLPSGQ